MEKVLIDNKVDVKLELSRDYPIHNFRILFLFFSFFFRHFR